MVGPSLHPTLHYLNALNRYKKKGTLDQTKNSSYNRYMVTWWGVQALVLEFNFCQILCWFLVELLPSLRETLIPPLHKLSVIMVVDFMGKIPDPLQLFIVIHCVFCRAQPLFCQFYAQCKCQDSFKLHINLYAATLRIILFLFLCLISSQYYIIEIAFSLNFSL